VEEKDPYTITELQIEKLPKIDLDSLYITKKIEASAFKTVLASTYQTAYRLYLITNSIKDSITEKQTNKVLYRSHFVSVKESSMYNQVQQTIQELDEFFKSNE